MNVLHFLPEKFSRVNVFGLILIFPDRIFLFLRAFNCLAQKSQCLVIMLGFILSDNLLRRIFLEITDNVRYWMLNRATHDEMDVVGHNDKSE